MDGGAWWATVHGIPKSWTRLRDFTFTFTPIKPGDGHGCCNSDTLDFLSWKLKMLLLLLSCFSRVRLCVTP